MSCILFILNYAGPMPQSFIPFLHKQSNIISSPDIANISRELHFPCIDLQTNIVPPPKPDSEPDFVRLKFKEGGIKRPSEFNDQFVFAILSTLPSGNRHVIIAIYPSLTGR